MEHGFLVTGVLFGLTAGITPGPLLSLVITETLKHGRGEGLKVAAAPLITDAPIVFLIVYILTSLPQNHFFIGLLSLLGACYVIYLGIKNIRVKRLPEGKQSGDRENALLQGIMTNALNPHPYIFWLSIGAPMMSRALTVHSFNAVLFILGFYALLVGSKVGITFAVDIFKAFLRSRYYLIIIRLLGVTLIVFGLFFIRDAIRILRTAQL